jgi:flagellar hook assembly protein FlgD
MVYNDQPLNQSSLVLSPNPFTTSLQIAFQNQTEYPMSVKVYDITGRLVKNLRNGAIYGSTILKWSGNDENGRAVSQGIYFIRVDNHDSGETSVHKVLKIK